MSLELFEMQFFETFSKLQKLDLLHLSVVYPDPGSAALDPWIRTRIRDGKKFRIRDEHPGSFFQELRNSYFLGLKY